MATPKTAKKSKRPATRTATKKVTKPAKPAAKPTKPASTDARTHALWEQYCEKPDRELLRVYADALAQAGNPRGTFINLCLLDHPTPSSSPRRRR
jgi:hypothetical protein